MATPLGEIQGKGIGAARVSQKYLESLVEPIWYGAEIGATALRSLSAESRALPGAIEYIAARAMYGGTRPIAANAADWSIREAKDFDARPDVAEAIGVLRDARVEALEEAAWKYAIEGQPRYVREKQDGCMVSVEIGRERPSRLLIDMLRAHRPEVYMRTGSDVGLPTMGEVGWRITAVPPEPTQEELDALSRLQPHGNGNGHNGNGEGKDA